MTRSYKQLDILERQRISLSAQVRYAIFASEDC